MDDHSIDEVRRLRRELEEMRRDRDAAKALALRAARERNALVRMCVTSSAADEWWSFVGRFGPVPYLSLVKSPTRAEAETIVRTTAVSRADAASEPS